MTQEQEKHYIALSRAEAAEHFWKGTSELLRLYPDNSESVMDSIHVFVEALVDPTAEFGINK